MDISVDRREACCFTGHRSIPLSDRDGVKKRLREQIIRLIDKGVILFIAGGALGFDTMAALEVLDLKSIYPHIKLRLAIPCVDQTKKWNAKSVEAYEYIMSRADDVVYTGKQYTPGCMHVRNRYMVDNSGYCIAYKTREGGGTSYTFSYALQNAVEVINVAL